MAEAAGGTFLMLAFVGMLIISAILVVLTYQSARSEVHTPRALRADTQEEETSE